MHLTECAWMLDSVRRFRKKHFYECMRDWVNEAYSKNAFWEKCFVSIDLFTNHLLSFWLLQIWMTTILKLYFSAIQTEQRIDTGWERGSVGNRWHKAGPCPHTVKAMSLFSNLMKAFTIFYYSWQYQCMLFFAKLVILLFWLKRLLGALKLHLHKCSQSSE